jgi:hypothetical protein
MKAFEAIAPPVPSGPWYIIADHKWVSRSWCPDRDTTRRRSISATGADRRRLLPVIAGAEKLRKPRQG